MAWRRGLVPALLLGLAYFLLASPLAHMEYGGTLAAIVWPAPALAIAVLWRQPYRQWGAGLLAILLAVMAAGLLDPAPPELDFQYALLNVCEVALCAFLGRRLISADGRLQTIRQLARFVLLLPLAGCAVAAALGASIAAHASQLDWLPEWRAILVGNGLAVLVLVPALLAWRGHDEAGRWMRGPTLAPAAVALALCLLAAAFHLSAEILRVALSLALAWAAIHGGLRAASLAVFVAALAGIALALCGIGPYSHAGDDGIWRLQVDLAGLALLSFFIAIALSERRALAQRLERARRFESLGMLAGGIAHDFNNVLAAAGGYAEMAQEQLEPDAPAAAAMQEVAQAVARGRDMTEQILLAARRGDRKRQVIDLRVAAAEALALAQPLCRPGVRLEWQPPAAPLPVLGHHGQLVRALLNLLRNAAQAAQGSVVMRAGSDDGSDDGGTAAGTVAVGDAPAAALWIEVADDGAGIAADDAQRLFDPFFSRRGGGTGLGLAIVAGIAVEHGGGVRFSRDGAGTPPRTRFRLLLPPTQESLPEPVAGTALAAAPASPLADGDLALVVDADQTRRETREEWLAELGFEPLGCADHDEALAALATAGPVLLLAPAAESALIAQVRRIAPELPLILCGAGTLADLPAATRLTEPFNRGALLAAIREVLRRQA